MRFLLLCLVVFLTAAMPAGAEAGPDGGLSKQRDVSVHSRVDPLWNGWLVRTYVDEDISLADAELYLRLEAARLILENDETHFVVVERRPVIAWGREAAVERRSTDRSPSCGARGRMGESTCGRWGRAGERNNRTERAAQQLVYGNRGIGAYVLAVQPDDPDARSAAETIARLEVELEQ